MNSLLTKNSSYSISKYGNILSLNFSKKQMELNDMKNCIEEIYNFLDKDKPPHFLSIKMTKECTIASSSRDLLAYFFTSYNFKKVAFLAKNRHQMSVGNLLVNTCKKNVAFKLCVFEIEVNDWLKD